MRTLADLRMGQSAIVTEVAGARPFRRRLLEMGVLPGTTVTITHVAPMGCPIEFEVRLARLSIRRVEATHVQLAEASGPSSTERP